MNFADSPHDQDVCALARNWCENQGSFSSQCGRSPLVLPFSNFERCKAYNLSKQSIFLRIVVISLALFCNFSNIEMSSTRNGDQTWYAYSKCGLTIETYSCFHKPMSLPTKVLFNMTNVIFAFLHEERCCSSQSRSLEMTPKSLSLFDLSKNPKLPSSSFT